MKLFKIVFLSLFFIFCLGLKTISSDLKIGSGESTLAKIIFDTSGSGGDPEIRVVNKEFEWRDDGETPYHRFIRAGSDHVILATADCEQLGVSHSCDTENISDWTSAWQDNGTGQTTLTISNSFFSGSSAEYNCFVEAKDTDNLLCTIGSKLSSTFRVECTDDNVHEDTDFMLFCIFFDDN